MAPPVKEKDIPGPPHKKNLAVCTSTLQAQYGLSIKVNLTVYTKSVKSSKEHKVRIYRTMSRTCEQ